MLDPEKTDDLILTNSMNCIPDPKCAYLAMKMVYEQFSGNKFDEPPPKQGKGKVKAIHYIQSFDPKDNISPELAHKIGRTLARKAFGDNCQVVIAAFSAKPIMRSH
ncbi:MAG: relaxase/mobilization nuclease domain-containing protein [Ruminococcaceae bacterium]|nr:relaxase/mobilization nuclease domain-containing protein [Oscillospiraceae bacterium]